MYQLLGRSEKGSYPGGESILEGVVQDTAPSNPSRAANLRYVPAQSSNQVIMRTMKTITGMPFPMDQLSRIRLAGRVSL